jgi:hypothetical protein
VTYSGSLYRGVVTRAGPTGVFVTMNAQWPGVEFGPCDIVANIVRVGPLTSQQATTSTNGDPAHSHTVTTNTSQTQWFTDLVTAGDTVLVVETGFDDFLIVGVIRSGVTTTGGA